MIRACPRLKRNAEFIDQTCTMSNVQNCDFFQLVISKIRF